MSNKRDAIPESVRRAVLIEAGFRCGVPACRTILLLDLHHIEHVSDDGGNEAHNLIALCPNCHALYHRQDIPRDAIRAWKNALVALNNAFDKEAMDDLIFLSGLKPGQLPITADGVLKFSRLIAAGLASFKRVFDFDVLPSKARPLEVKSARFEVVLTDKGQAFIEAWRKGDRELIEKSLTTPVPSDLPVWL